MKHKCRFCESPLTETFVDMGLSPLSNSFVREEDLFRRSSYYPLHTFVCDTCFLVQVEEFESPDEIFADYAYFSSFSESWLQHARTYVNFIVDRFGYDQSSQVIEIACNDGYLLQFFAAKGIPSLGIEPASNVAEEARKKEISVITEFFGSHLARVLREQGRQADLLIGNNVLAHVPDIKDFVVGFKELLSVRGVITMEFPHLMRLISENQFDTIYHEHFSYLSFRTVQSIFSKFGLTIFDVEELKTHGGSLRIYAKHENDQTKQVSGRIKEMEQYEIAQGQNKIDTYRLFSDRVKQTKRSILQFIINQKNEGKTIVGYGAPAKGNTLLNYCGIGTDMIEYVVDRNPYKQGLFLPGTHIPVYAPKKIRETKPDFVVIMPWNLKDEIMDQISFIREWGGKFVVWIPQTQVIE